MKLQLLFVIALCIFAIACLVRNREKFTNTSSQDCQKCSTDNDCMQTGQGGIPIQWYPAICNNGCCMK